MGSIKQDLFLRVSDNIHPRKPPLQSSDLDQSHMIVMAHQIWFKTVKDSGLKLENVAKTLGNERIAKTKIDLDIFRGSQGAFKTLI